MSEDSTSSLSPAAEGTPPAPAPTSGAPADTPPRDVVAIADVLAEGEAAVEEARLAPVQRRDSRGRPKGSRDKTKRPARRDVRQNPQTGQWERDRAAAAEPAETPAPAPTAPQAKPGMFLELARPLAAAPFAIIAARNDDPKWRLKPDEIEETAVAIDRVGCYYFPQLEHVNPLWALAAIVVTHALKRMDLSALGIAPEQLAASPADPAAAAAGEVKP